MPAPSPRAATYRIATVLDIGSDDNDNRRVSLIDQDTSTPFEVALSAPGGTYPRVGDTWLLRRDLGFWALSQCLRLVSNEANPERSMGDIVQSLTDRGLIQPTFGGGSDPEAPHLAKIGEVRLFSYVPDPYYWPEADGSTVNRIDYRELGDQLFPGTSETFDLPIAAIFGDGTPYVCAR